MRSADRRSRPRVTVSPNEKLSFSMNLEGHVHTGSVLDISETCVRVSFAANGHNPRAKQTAHQVRSALAAAGLRCGSAQPRAASVRRGRHHQHRGRSRVWPAEPSEPSRALLVALLNSPPPKSPWSQRLLYSIVRAYRRNTRISPARQRYPHVFVTDGDVIPRDPWDSRRHVFVRSTKLRACPISKASPTWFRSTTGSWSCRRPELTARSSRRS